MLKYIIDNETITVSYIVEGKKKIIRIPVYVIVDKQKFKNPDTGNMVQYSSLPTEARNLIKEKLKKAVSKLDKSGRKKLLAKYRSMKKDRLGITDKEAKESTKDKQEEKPKPEKKAPIEKKSEPNTKIEDKEDSKETPEEKGLVPVKNHEPIISPDDFENSKPLQIEYKDSEEDEKEEDRYADDKDVQDIEFEELYDDDEEDITEENEQKLTPEDFTPNINKENYATDKKGIEEEYETHIKDHSKQMEKHIKNAPNNEERDKRQKELDKFIDLKNKEKTKKLKESANRIIDPIDRYDALLKISEDNKGDKLTTEEKLSMVNDMYKNRLQESNDEEEEQKLLSEKQKVVNKINKESGKPIEFTDKDKKDLEKIANEAIKKIPSDPKARGEYYKKAMNDTLEDYVKRLETGDVHDDESEQLKIMAKMGITPEDYEKNKEEFEKTKNIDFDLGNFGKMLNFVQMFFDFLKG